MIYPGRKDIILLQDSTYRLPVTVNFSLLDAGTLQQAVLDADITDKKTGELIAQFLFENVVIGVDTSTYDIVLPASVTVGLAESKGKLRWEHSITFGQERYFYVAGNVTVQSTGTRVQV